MSTFSNPIAPPPVLLSNRAAIIKRDGIDAAKTHMCWIRFDPRSEADLV